MRKSGVFALGVAALYGCAYHTFVSQEPSPTYPGHDSGTSIVELNKKYRPVPGWGTYVKRELKLDKIGLEGKLEPGNAEAGDFLSPDESEETLQCRADELKNLSYDDLLKLNLSPRDVAICCTRILKHMGEKYDRDTYKGDFWQSGRVTWKIKGGDCDDGASFAVATLYPRFKPYILTMSDGYMYAGRFASKLDSGHAVMLIRDKEMEFGALGINKEDVVPPIYATVQEVVNEIGRRNHIIWKDYDVYDLNVNGTDFVNGIEDNSPLGK